MQFQQVSITRACLWAQKRTPGTFSCKRLIDMISKSKQNNTKEEIFRRHFFALSVSRQNHSKNKSYFNKIHPPKIICLWDVDSSKPWGLDTYKENRTFLIMGKNRALSSSIVSLPRGIEEMSLLLSVSAFLYRHC